MRVSRIIGALILYVSLLLISINTIAMIYQSPAETVISGRVAGMSTCLKIYSLMNASIPIVKSGGSFIRNSMVMKWYIFGIKGENVRVSILYNRTNNNESVILLQDYNVSSSNLYGLAEILASRGYIVVIPELKIIKDISETNYINKWIYSSILITRKTISFLKEELNTTRIYIIGLSMGGIVALLTAIIDHRVNKAISLEGLGLINDSISSGSLLNYYYKRYPINTICYDPCKLPSNRSLIIFIGLGDEYFPYIAYRKILSLHKYSIILSPKTDHFKIPSYWENLLISMLEKNTSITNYSGPSIYAETPYLLSINTYGNTSIVERISIPGFPWITYGFTSPRKLTLTYYVLPGEYLVINDNAHSVYGPYYTSPLLGFVLGAVLLIIWVILSWRELVSVKLSFIEVIYILLLVSLLFYPVYPAIWAPNRFHISLMTFMDVYSSVLLFINYLYVLSVILQPLFLVLIYYVRSRSSYMIYVGTPIFFEIIAVTTYLFLGLRFNNVFLVIPTIPFIISILIVVIEYLFSEK